MVPELRSDPGLAGPREGLQGTEQRGVYASWAWRMRRQMLATGQGAGHQRHVAVVEGVAHGDFFGEPGRGARNVGDIQAHGADRRGPLPVEVGVVLGPGLREDGLGWEVRRDRGRLRSWELRGRRAGVMLCMSRCEGAGEDQGRPQNVAPTRPGRRYGSPGSRGLSQRPWSGATRTPAPLDGPP